MSTPIDSLSALTSAPAGASPHLQLANHGRHPTTHQVRGWEQP